MMFQCSFPIGLLNFRCWNRWTNSPAIIIWISKWSQRLEINNLRSDYLAFGATSFQEKRKEKEALKKQNMELVSNTLFKTTSIMPITITKPWCIFECTNLVTRTDMYLPKSIGLKDYWINRYILRHKHPKLICIYAT